MRRIHLAALLLALLATQAIAKEAPPPPLDASTRDFDQLHLDIRVEPDLTAGTIDGRVTIEFEARVEGLQKLRLHCEDTRVLAVVDAEARALPFTHDQGILGIDLAEPVALGGAAEVTVAYRSQPTRGIYFHRPTKAHPETPFFLYSQGQSNDNRRWFPCYDLPDDRFSFDLHAVVPPEFDTVSNGTRVAREEIEGKRRDHWRFEDRAPSYLVSLVVAELETITETWRESTLEFSAVPGHTEAIRQALGDTRNMLEYFSTWLDEPYPWSRYAQTFVWDFVYGGMENVTATTLNMRALHRATARPNYLSEGLVAHELAHMWFGDLITCRTWHDIWLNEGFATYLTDLYFGHRVGSDEFQLRRRSQNRGYMDGTPHPENLGLERHPRGDRPLELSGGKAYNRGAGILHMLRLELGDELFRKAIIAYVDAWRDRAVGSEDFRRVVEQVAGRDLAWFWNQWVYGAGYPVLDVRYDVKSRRLEVRQVQARKSGQGLFRFTLPVRAGAEGPVQGLRIWRDYHVFHVPAPQAPNGSTASHLRVGVGGDLLARIRFPQHRDAARAQVLTDPDVTGRLDAVETLAPFGVDVAPLLAEVAAADPSYAVRKACIEALGAMDKDGAALGGILASVKDPDPRVREAAFTAQARRTRAETGGVLLEGITRETHDYPLAAAARALGAVKPEGAYEALLGLLARDSHGDIVRAGALDGLRALGDPRAAGIAQTYVDYAWGKGGTQRMRKTALDCVLALAPDAPETHRCLVALLSDPHRSMREWAADACGTYEVRAARGTLAALAKNDPTGGVRRAAERALKRLGQP